MSDRENLIFALGRFLGYRSGHYNGWVAAVAWAQRYWQATENFAEATQAGMLITLKRGNIAASEISPAWDSERANGLGEWLGRICREA